MTVHELSREQLTELKQHYLSFDKDEERCLSYDELANIGNLVTDDEVYEYYAGYEFVNDDFACSCEH